MYKTKTYKEHQKISKLIIDNNIKAINKSYQNMEQAKNRLLELEYQLNYNEGKGS